MVGLAIGAVATGVGSALSSSKASKNANKAAEIEAATARENNALTREIYGKNEATLSPFVQTGSAAGALLNDFYGIEPAAGKTDWAAYVNDDEAAYRDWQSNWAGGQGALGNKTIEEYGQFHYNLDGKRRDLTPFTSAPNTARSAFADYIANSDYAFQQQEGGNKVNSGYAGAGTVQSGAAMRALEKYRQNLQSGYRGEWAGGVANQQGVGLTAAGALAGVSTNFGNTIAASNTAASNARANAALSQQSVFGNALGTAGGALMKGFG